MKTNVFFIGFAITVLSLLSCSNDQIEEDLQEIEFFEIIEDQLDSPQSIDKDEIEEDDT